MSLSSFTAATNVLTVGRSKCMSTMEWFRNDRKYTSAICGAVAACLVFGTVRTGDYFENGWLHPRLIGAILLGTFCLGLFFRQEWTRWIGSAFISGAVVLVLFQTYLHGISLVTVGTLVCSPFFLWYLWKLPITKAQEDRSAFATQLSERAEKLRRNLDSLERWKIAVLFRQPIELNAERLSRIARRAFGDSFAVVDEEIQPVDALFLPSEHCDPVVAGISPVLICYRPPHLLAIYAIPHKHPNLSDDRNGHNGAAREVIDEHRAYVELEVLPYVELEVLPYIDNIDPVENGYTISGRLAAELINDQCAGIYFPEPGRVVAMFPGLPDALRSPNPTSALDP